MKPWQPTNTPTPACWSHAIRDLIGGAGVAMLLTTLVTTPAAAGRRDLHDCKARFGFCLILPNTMAAQAEPANGDGRQFRQAGGLEVTVSGINNVLGSTLAGEQRDQSRRFDRISQRAQGSNWFLLTGMRSGQTQILKCCVGPGSIQSVQLRLPPAQAARRRNELEAIVASFRPGDLAISH